jgi:O-antigen/teichoic acid export membrane protein
MEVMLVPATARVAMSGAERSASFNRAMISHFGLFSALITVVIMLAPSLIVQTIFGPGFTLAAPALLMMAPGLLASAISIPFVSALTGSTRNRLVAYLLIFTTLPRILLLVVLTHYWSLLGTALATMLSEYLLALCCIVLARFVKMSFPLGALVRPYLLGAIAYGVGLGAMLLGANPLLAVTLAALVFARDLLKVARSIRMRTAA